jgi:hypothetical protein
MWMNLSMAQYKRKSTKDKVEYQRDSYDEKNKVNGEV